MPISLLLIGRGVFAEQLPSIREARKCNDCRFLLKFSARAAGDTEHYSICTKYSVDEDNTENFDWDVGGEKSQAKPPCWR